MPNPIRFRLLPIGTLVCVVVVAGVLSCDGATRRRIHAENVVKAEHFKREFDAHVPKGTTLTAVEDYLRSKPVKVQRSMGFHDGRDFVKELMIEVAAERSVNWYCGTASVGLMAQFDADTLTDNYVSSWSFDCP